MKEYRKEFLKKMENYDSLMTKYVGEELVEVAPDLAPGQKRHVLVVHDESCFHANDGKKVAWCRDGDQIIKPKSQGRAIMISDFLCECHGPLYVTLQDGTKSYARAVIRPGINYDGWWTNEDLVKQFKEIGRAHV